MHALCKQLTVCEIEFLLHCYIIVSFMQKLSEVESLVVIEFILNNFFSHNGNKPKKNIGPVNKRRTTWKKKVFIKKSVSTKVRVGKEGLSNPARQTWFPHNQYPISSGLYNFFSFAIFIKLFKPSFSFHHCKLQKMSYFHFVN